jgi:hypothetical protein
MAVGIRGAGFKETSANVDTDQSVIIAAPATRYFPFFNRTYQVIFYGMVFFRNSFYVQKIQELPVQDVTPRPGLLLYDHPRNSELHAQAKNPKRALARLLCGILGHSQWGQSQI